MGNPLKDFDFAVLLQDDFKEDAVREEIIFPLLRALGYSSKPPYQLLRSKPLLHPFVYIGSKKHNIHIIPDYTIKINDRITWILDAKSPKEDICSGKNPEQAYSYAIHKDVRAKYYALCNGREFTLFDIFNYKPIIHVDLSSTEAFPSLREILVPSVFINDLSKESGYPDFGLHLVKLGLASENTFQIFEELLVYNIGRINNENLTLISYIYFENIRYAISIDFSDIFLDKILGKLSIDHQAIIRTQIKAISGNAPLDILGIPLKVSVAVRIGQHILNSHTEDYLPFILEDIFVG